MSSVRQFKPFSLVSQDGTVELPAFDADVAAGSTIAVLVGLEKSDTGQTVLLSSVSGGGTWASPVNERSSGDYAPNAAGCYVENVSAGAPSIVLAVNQSSSVRATGAVIEIEGVVTSSGVDKLFTEPNAGASATTNSTGTSGDLAQANNIVLAGNFGYNGVNTTLGSPWTDLHNQQNGVAGALGGYVAWRTVAATTALNITFTHDASAGGACVLMVIKDAPDATHRYVFDFDKDELPSGQTNIECLIARNVEPMSDGAEYEYYSGITAETGTKSGDADTRQIIITGVPGDVVDTDTIQGSFRVAGAPTKGSVAWFEGTVEEI